ncbi:MAG: PAS domain S-box protein [Bacteroidales bacterium]|nr:PAS domain S-box protein [Bacteroidales bacterium]
MKLGFMEYAGYKADNSGLRKKAEKLHKKLESKKHTQLTEGEGLKLIHELEVHQIELELQNEELLLAKAELQETTEKYVELYDFAPNGYLTLSREGKILNLNFNGAKMLGKERSKLINSRFSFFISGQTIETFNTFFEKTFTGNRKETCEVALVNNGSSSKHALLTGIITENKEQCFVTAVDITDRKLSEEALMHSKNELQKYWDSDIAAIYIASVDGDLINFNPTFRKLFGIDEEMYPEQLSMLRFYKNPGDRTVLIRKVTENGKVENYELDFIQSNGGHIHAIINANGIYDEAGKLIGIRGFIVDITERKLAEQELIKQSQAINQSPVSILITDINGNIEYANPKVAEITGYTIDELIGKNSRIFSLGNKTKKEYQDLWETISSGNIWVGEFQNKKKDGTLYWESASISPIINEKGVVTNYVAVKEDVTKRKQIEKEIARNEKELKRAQQITHVGSWHLNVETNEVKWTEELYKMYGFDPLLPPPLYTDHMRLFTAESWELLSASLAKTAETGIPYELELKTVRKDGSNGWMWARGEAEFDKEGKIIGLSGAAQDISQRKLMEEELLRAKEKAEESDRLKSAFLANMSHEIRTPMNGILGFAELLKEPNLRSEKQQEYIAIIERSGERMLNIINEIIDISRIQSGQMPVNFSDVDLNKCIDDCYKFFEPEAAKRNLELKRAVAFQQGEARIKTDFIKLNSALVNLIKNAFKYTQKGSIEFGYKLNDAKTALKFYVKDTGIGIPVDRQVAIFERFIQADIEDKMAQQGAGLGLTITKAYIEMLGGKIWVESAVGKGSTFYFTLPYKPVKLSQYKIAESKELKQITNLKLLIVEDDDASCQWLKHTMKELAKEIFAVKTGNEAIEVCHNNTDIDLILMDIQLPGMNGYEATRKIREFDKNVVIIAQTAFALSGDREKSIEAGCDDYVSKPINNVELHKLIEKYFGK